MIADTLGVTFIDASDYESAYGVHPGVKGMRQIASIVLYPTDKALTQPNMPADAKKIGDEIGALKDALINQIAKPFDTETGYHIGDYVTRDGKLYRRIGQSTAAAAWKASNWKEVADGLASDVKANT